MYMARVHDKGKTEYIIRASYADGEVYRSRDLIRLGADPRRLVEYPGGNAFYIVETVESGLAAAGVTPAGDELEDLFWDFVRPDIRARVAYFRRRGKSGKPGEPPPRPGDIHIFDRRRLLFLRTGRMDQRGLGRLRGSFCRPVARKSRDEIEQYFMAGEQILPEREWKSYLYVIFDLQRDFSQSYARTMPHVLDAGEVEEAFLRSVCRLDEDADFWKGMDRPESRMNRRLSPYITRYVAKFFDADFGRSTLLEDLVQDWMNRHRTHRPPPNAVKPASGEEVARIFDMPEPELRKLSARELNRLYRKRAGVLHPDTGGDHETFIRLSEIYHALKKNRRK